MIEVNIKNGKHTIINPIPANPVPGLDSIPGWYGQNKENTRMATAKDVTRRRSQARM
jgi:hypothetical protein